MTVELFDTHQHLIYRDQAGYDWTLEEDVLKEGDFTLTDYQKLTETKGVAGTLFMECGVNDEDYQKEIHYVFELSKNPSNNIKGIISSIRPEIDDGFEAWLEESNELSVVGYRRILHVVDDAMSQNDSFRANVRRIGQAGKTFDMCFLERQLPIALEFAKACDNTSLILDHCGVPDIISGQLDQWRKDIKALAALPNVSCKLSGIMAYCAPDNSSLEAITPYVDHVLEVFGTDRVMWGSDWPVVNIAHGLPTWIDVTREILSKFSEDEATKIARGNAEKIYGVSLS